MSKVFYACHVCLKYVDYETIQFKEYAPGENVGWWSCEEHREVEFDYVDG